ncbi:Outer membrane protein (OmpH-like) [Rosistilla ulvae]|uniref:Outer membrane protein (OmpH-like) n=1 Tax=Rosistilla ulvae TaxID=1930277 RepID=A0A517LYU4_9BACT|nr:OmpH family outer membrane protein [Rosistilla ulvae]QDS87790.1 Outer membrane protein (OmpH-like) [Rosistilla ulvae]
MRRPSVLILMLGTLAIGMAVPLRCPAESPTAAGRFAIIDVAYIFKNAASIKAEVAAIEQQMAGLQRYGKAKQQEMLEEAKAIQALKPGSIEYARQEEKVAELESSLKLEVFRRRKSLADAEASLYFANYQKMHQIIAQLAQYNNIDLVLRYDGEGMDIDKPDTVLRSVMKNVVYRSDAIDLTQIVLAAMEKTQVAAKPVANALH